MLDFLKGMRMLPTETKGNKSIYYIYFTFCGVPYKKALSHIFYDLPEDKKLYKQYNLTTGKLVEKGLYNEHYQKVGKWLSFNSEGKLFHSEDFDDFGKCKALSSYRSKRIVFSSEEKKDATICSFFRDGVILFHKVDSPRSLVTISYRNGRMKKKTFLNRKNNVLKRYCYDEKGKLASLSTRTSLKNAWIMRTFGSQGAWHYVVQGKDVACGIKKTVFAAFMKDLKKSKAADCNRQKTLALLRVVPQISERKNLLKVLRAQAKEKTVD